MLAYPTALMSRPMAAPGMLPQPFHQLHSFPMALAPTVLHAQLPPAVPPMFATAVSPTNSTCSSAGSEKVGSPTAKPSRSSFSIDSILAKKDDRASNGKDAISPPAAATPVASTSDGYSPRTPFSAGVRSGGLFYLYTQAPATPCAPYPFPAAAASPTGSELQRSPLCPLSAAPMALIPDIMRQAGETINVYCSPLCLWLTITPLL